jgi:hypothetical protein
MPNSHVTTSPQEVRIGSFVMSTFWKSILWRSVIWMSAKRRTLGRYFSKRYSHGQRFCLKMYWGKRSMFLLSEAQSHMSHMNLWITHQPALVAWYTYLLVIVSANGAEDRGFESRQGGRFSGQCLYSTHCIHCYAVLCNLICIVILCIWVKYMHVKNTSKKYLRESSRCFCGPIARLQTVEQKKL